MTHIVTNGQYLIADKRTSFTYGSNGDQTGKRPGTRRARFCRDDAVKITVLDQPVYVKKPTDKDPSKRIVAVALAGRSGSSEAHPVNMLQRLGSLMEYGTLLNDHVFSQTAFTLVCLVEDGSVVVLVQNEHRWSMDIHSAKSLASGVFVARGTGSEHRLLENAYAKKQITLMDAFFYGSHLDKSSTTDYSVYGLKENHLFTTVRPTPEEVRDSYDKVRAVFEFKGLKTRYLPTTYDVR